MIGIGYAPGAFDLFHIGICCFRPGSAFFGIIRPGRRAQVDLKAKIGVCPAAIGGIIDAVPTRRVRR
jgi:hypothetical protein